MWVTQITQIIFNFEYDIWEERNKERHERDATEKDSILVESWKTHPKALNTMLTMTAYFMALKEVHFKHLPKVILFKMAMETADSKAPKKIRLKE